MAEALPTAELQRVLMSYQFQKGHTLLCTNFSSAFYYEMDVISVSKADLIYEFEIKRSRSDFKADFNKEIKHKRLSEGENVRWHKIPNYFYYACQPNLIDISEVPAYAGLVYIEGENVVYIKKAPRLHKEKCSIETVRRIAVTLAARQIFGSSYFTYQKKEQVRQFEEYERKRKEGNA